MEPGFASIVSCLLVPPVPSAKKVLYLLSSSAVAAAPYRGSREI